MHFDLEPYHFDIWTDGELTIFRLTKVTTKLVSTITNTKLGGTILPRT